MAPSTKATRSTSKRASPGDRPDACVCATGRVERFLQACVLLFLTRGPSHGYELFQNLAAFGFGKNLPGTATLYRNLRRMEKNALIASEWQAGKAGPGRRSYRLTSKGKTYLERWAEALAHDRALIERFLQEKDGRLATANSRGGKVSRERVGNA
ncbi:MAG: PadR family transcriptional regulator [Candidatus Riflebacteria bacterium]|nr:PadR family transcriptional regulator [Candidatus Riflebacteria bacterium]